MSGTFKTFVSPNPRRIAALIRGLPLHTIYAWSNAYSVRVGALDPYEEKKIDGRAGKVQVKAAKGEAGKWSKTDIIRLDEKEQTSLVKRFKSWSKKNDGTQKKERGRKAKTKGARKNGRRKGARKNTSKRRKA